LVVGGELGEFPALLKQRFLNHEEPVPRHEHVHVGKVSAARGRKIGEQMNDDYKTALDTSRLSREQVSAVLVDLKRRIQGDFYVIEENDEKIVLGNRVCPFAEKVVGRTSMCMMTSNVFGVIVAENLGYARVVLNETIARGNSGCRVTVYLRQSEEPGQPAGREYFQ